jgi:murein L,D-transpeptidase YafK
MPKFRSFRTYVEYQLFCWKVNRKVRYNKKMLNKAFSGISKEADATVLPDSDTLVMQPSLPLQKWALWVFMVFFVGILAFAIPFDHLSGVLKQVLAYKSELFRSAGSPPPLPHGQDSVLVVHTTEDSVALRTTSTTAEQVEASSLNPSLPETEVTQESFSPLWPADTILLASKKDEQLIVYVRSGAKWEPAKFYSISSGMQEGDKFEEGDRKTPEGHYYIINLVPGESQGDLYGPLVFELNYPNSKDLVAGKTGSGIWIHGVQMASELTPTRGCVSLTNSDVVDLMRWVRVGTPVVILDQMPTNPNFSQLFLASHFGSIEHYQSDLPTRDLLRSNYRARLQRTAENYLRREERMVRSQEVLAQRPGLNDQVATFLQQWSQDWSRRDTASYNSAYHPEFRGSNGMRRDPFLERKANIFFSRDSIRVVVANPMVSIEHNGKLKVTFHQNYRAWLGSDVQNWTGNKTMLLQKDDSGEIKIIQE